MPSPKTPKSTYAKARDLLERLETLILSDERLSGPLVRDSEVLRWRRQALFGMFKDRLGRTAPEGRAPSGMSGGLAFRAGAAWLMTQWEALRFAVTKPAALVYGIDRTSGPGGHDFRMRGLYEGLDREGVAYGEILHTILDEGFMSRRRIRRRGAVYLEAYDLRPFLMSKFRPAVVPNVHLDGFVEDERLLIKETLSFLFKEIPKSRNRIRRFRKLLRSVRPKAVFGIDDVRHFNELVAACQDEGVPFHAFQHGHFTQYHVGWMKSDGMPVRTQPAAYHLWSGYWKDEYVRLGGAYDTYRLAVSGNPKTGEAPELQPPTPFDGNGLHVLVPYESEAPKDELKPYIDALIGADDVKVSFSVRPDIDREAQLAEYGLDVDDVDVVERMPEGVHAVVGTYSTFLYDVIAMGKPVIMPETSLDYGVGMIENGLAAAVGEDGFLQAVREVVRGAERLVPDAQDRLYSDEGDFRSVFEGMTERNLKSFLN